MFATKSISNAKGVVAILERGDKFWGLKKISESNLEIVGPFSIVSTEYQPAEGVILVFADKDGNEYRMLASEAIAKFRRIFLCQMVARRYQRRHAKMQKNIFPTLPDQVM